MNTAMNNHVVFNPVAQSIPFYGIPTNNPGVMFGSQYNKPVYNPSRAMPTINDNCVSDPSFVNEIKINSLIHRNNKVNSMMNKAIFHDTKAAYDYIYYNINPGNNTLNTSMSNNIFRDSKAVRDYLFTQEQKLTNQANNNNFIYGSKPFNNSLNNESAHDASKLLVENLLKNNHPDDKFNDPKTNSPHNLSKNDPLKVTSALLRTSQHKRLEENKFVQNNSSFEQLDDKSVDSTNKTNEIPVNPGETFTYLRTERGNLKAVYRGYEFYCYRY